MAEGQLGIKRGIFPDFAVRVKSEFFVSQNHRVTPSNEIPKRCIIKALQDSNKKPDSDFFISGDENDDFSEANNTKLKKKKKGKHRPFMESYGSISMPSDVDNETNVSDLEFSDTHVTLEEEDANDTVPDLSSEELIKDPKHLLVQVLDKLEAVRLHALALEQWNAVRLKECDRFYHISATNLIQYAALRSMDVQQLQEALSIIGLSNLEGINAHIMASLTSIIQILQNLTHVSSKTKREISFDNEVQSPTIEVSNKNNPTSNLQSSVLNSNRQYGEIAYLAMKSHACHNAELLLGSSVEGRKTRIMVTVGSESADDEKLIYNLIKSGVNVIRINCAHDNPDIWRHIIKRVRDCSQMLEKPCRVLMDLAGPKLRTGPFKPGPNIKKIKPMKDAKGAVLTPALVWISPSGVAPPIHRSPDAVLPLNDKNWIRNLEVGDVLNFSDARGKKRCLKISEKFPTSSEVGCWAECYETSYVESGTELRIKGKKGKIGSGKVAELPNVDNYVQVKAGDLLVIIREPCLAPSKISNDDLVCPQKVTCSLGLLFDSVQPGEPIEFDDGKIRGVIRGVKISEICVEITHTGEKVSKLGPEKSINVPKSNLRFGGLTVKDLLDLDFIAANADMVGVSFVNDVNDVRMLQQELNKRNLKKLGIVLKIETHGGFERLPLLLLQAMQSPNPLGVMIARGDLAVECGWERLAELQEEILSICEAAHIPAIWATQVLESLAKSGLPTRAEITDAAVGGRADCVMLNKGKHIVKAVSTLDSILRNTCNQQPRMKAVLKPLLLSSLF
ncbi:plastidial pyruvate kinase 4, chloroplastic isoform X2 [Cryptomeria japonica]|uniref:plastidial pyruvate kinase 4, chloroplastic isoform X2 n=1 Tax=Cryptomeria japonica TaxID=3369 RepID=UPI0025AC6F72|nr:plastidial pyruvate kinase 4, chloroplastic isoform X2 [Cryptomeria japonica]